MERMLPYFAMVSRYMNTLEYYIMIIECSILHHIKGLKIKARQKGGHSIAIAYNSRQSLVENAKYALLSLCLILGINNKKFVYSVVGDVVLFVGVLTCNSNVFTV